MARDTKHQANLDYPSMTFSLDNILTNFRDNLAVLLEVTVDDVETPNFRNNNNNFLYFKDKVQFVEFANMVDNKNKGKMIVGRAQMDAMWTRCCSRLGMLGLLLPNTSRRIWLHIPRARTGL